VVGFVIAGIFSQACASEAREGPSDEIPVVRVSAQWAAGPATDVALLLETYPTVLVGPVDKRIGQSDGDLTSGLEQLNAFPELPVTFFDVTVEVALSNDISVGDSLTVQQAGGIVTLASGQNARLLLEQDEALVVGNKYMFFLTPSPIDENVLVTSPFARLSMSGDGRFEPLPGWENMAAMSTLAELNIQQAGAVVAGLSSD